jgi:cell division protein ZipA
MSFRTLLIIVGVFIIAGVYLFSVRKRRRDSRVIYERGFSRLDVPDVILQANVDTPEDSDDWEIVTKASAQPEPVISRQPEVPVARKTVIEELPQVRNEDVARPEPSNARRRVDQLELFGTPEPAPTTRKGTRGKDASAPASAPPDNGLITLFVRAREGQTIPGTTLVKAFNAVGMQHGDMAIFHHFGAGELLRTKPIFSAANMFEPGTFDLAKIEAFRTAGVALFLQLPGALDGPVAFELLLNTAQRLTELVDSELYATPKDRLDSKHIARLRGRAAKFAHAG